MKPLETLWSDGAGGAPERVKLASWWREAEMALTSLNPTLLGDLTKPSIAVLGPFLLGATAWELVVNRDGADLGNWEFFKHEVE